MGTEDVDAPDDHQSRSPKLVVIGASAGGLEPLQEFFSVLGEIENAAFVVIQHLSPDYKSMMGELLARNTPLKISTVTEETEIEPGHVYLIPPAYNIFLRSRERFGLDRKRPGVVNLPIDIFTTSAASIYGADMYSIIMSGTGSDGVRGIVAVNAAGGLNFCQSPETAQFDGMPNSAVATGFIDEMGDPGYLADRLRYYIENVDPASTPPLGTTTSTTPQTVGVGDVLQELKLRTGIPFDAYKSNTVTRRIERRLALKHVTSLDQYLKTLKTDDVELETLRREILIGVTSFFRDPKSYDDLLLAISDLVSRKNNGDAIRFWIAGCSTGEEAYSIAILLHECIELSGKSFEVKIFATDVEQSYLDLAVTGTYPETISAEVSAERLLKYFTKVGEQYRITPDIRKWIIFAKHNMITDAPFTRMDLVSCRNVLIYFETELQERVLRRFQYALGANGLLFLGSSETLGNVQRDFFVVSNTAKIFRTLRPAALSLDALQTDPKTLRYQTGRPANERATAGLPIPIENARQVLIQDLAPPSILLDHNREIIHVFGDISPFIKIPRGDVSFDMSRLLNATAASTLIALFKGLHDGERSVQSEPLNLRSDAPQSFHRLSLTSVGDDQLSEKLVILSFIEVQVSTITTSSDGSAVISDNEVTQARFEMMQNELVATRQSLQNTIEELETSNEELQATNEELLASNEELQSTNEELQSVNEELYTVNSEYQEKIRVLDQLNSDLDTMARATGIPTVFLDSDLLVTRFTPSIDGIYDLRPSDIGRPLGDFASKIGYGQMLQDARDALTTASVKEIVWTTPSSTRLIIRHVPYADAHSDRLCLVIMFLDVTLIERVDYLQSVIDSLPEHIAVLDQHGDIAMVNSAWNRFAEENSGAPDEMGLGSPYLDVCMVQKDSNDYTTAVSAADGLKAVLSGERETFSLVYPCHSPTAERWFMMHAAKLRSSEGGAVVSHTNMTDWQARMDAEGRTGGQNTAKSKKTTTRTRKSS